MNSAHQHRFLLRLLFDEELRERFAVDPLRAAADAGLAPEDAAVFAEVDLFGLGLDAGGRRQYLMSALCRPFPLTAGALGAATRAAEALSAFLAGPALYAPLGLRTALFGDHLSRLLDLNAMDAPTEAVALLRHVLSLERGLVDNAARLRAAVTRGEPPPLPRRVSGDALLRGHLALPPYAVAAVLPTPTDVLRAALDGIGPGDAWARITAGHHSFDRVITVARADPSPVTVLCRGIVGSVTTERAGAGGASPLIEVRHLQTELSGRRDGWLRSIDGSFGVRDLPASQQRLATALAEAGLLEIRQGTAKTFM